MAWAPALILKFLRYGANQRQTAWKQPKKSVWSTTFGLRVRACWQPRLRIIEERCAELVFLRTVGPQGPTQSAGVAPETGARTDDEALGRVGSQGVARGPQTVDTDTAGTAECAVQAGASDAEGCGMDASGDF